MCIPRFDTRVAYRAVTIFQPSSLTKFFTTASWRVARERDCAASVIAPVILAALDHPDADLTDDVQRFTARSKHRRRPGRLNA